MNVGEFIDALGGRTAVSVKLGVQPTAVSNWRTLGSIPPQHFIAFRRLCRERDVPFDEELFQKLTGRDRAELTGEQ